MFSKSLTIYLNAINYNVIMRLMYTKKECLREHKYSIKSGAIKYISLFVVFLLSIYINFILIQLYYDIYRGIKDEFFYMFPS